MYRSPAESPEISKARMRSHLDVVLDRKFRCSVHDQRIACMKSAGHVRGTHDGQHFGIVAESIDPKALAKVAVQVDNHARLLTPTQWSSSDRCPIRDGQIVVYRKQMSFDD